jgi:hypothetical protein
MGQRALAAAVAILVFASASHAFDVEAGACERILSGKARVRIHFTSGVKAEVEPVRIDNVTPQLDVFPDGRRVRQTWLGGGGLLPLESPQGQFIYADRAVARLQFVPGETRALDFDYRSGKGHQKSGKIALQVENVEKAAFGACQATFVTVTMSTAWTGDSLSSKIVRLYVKELGFFVASIIDRKKDGKTDRVTFRASRIELIR